MSRAVLVLANDGIREKAKRWIDGLPPLTRVEFKGPKRTIPQNDRFWAMLTAVSQQVTHHGIKLTPDDWKLIFLDALKREVRMVPNLGGTGLVSLGRSSSDLSKEEFSDLFAVIEEWSARNGVDLGER